MKAENQYNAECMKRVQIYRKSHKSITTNVPSLFVKEYFQMKSCKLQDHLNKIQRKTKICLLQGLKRST